MTEDVLQSKFFKIIWNEFPQTRRLLFHCPNELERLPKETEENHIKRVIAMRSKGVVKGAHDNFFLWQGQMHTLELKVGNNELSKEQEKFGEAWASHGAIIHTARSVEESVEIIKTIIR